MPAPTAKIVAEKIAAEVAAEVCRPDPRDPPSTKVQVVTYTATIAAERGWNACLDNLRKTRKRKAHPLCVAPKPCVCADCSLRTALAHAAADAKCGRRWTCQCAACKVVSELPEFHRTPVVPEH